VFDFCPNCGQSIGQDQKAGRMLTCVHCGKDIGFVGEVRAEQHALPNVGSCPVCQQSVEVRAAVFVPHYAPASRKICPGSGKAVQESAAKKPQGKDLSAFMTHDVHKVICCARKNEPRIDVLTLEYLDKSERVRIQIEALREMLGSDFCLAEYPPLLKKPHLAMWRRRRRLRDCDER
jgi:hypothetical protein